MKKKLPADRLRLYLDTLLRTGRYDRLLANRFFQGTITSVRAVGSSYICQVRRVGDQAADGNDYLCVTPGYLPVLADVVECEWRDANTGYVLWPVNGVSRADRPWASTTLTAASASVPIAVNLPAHGYRNLEIEIQARGDTAATSVECGLRFNGDSGNDYGWVRVSASGAAVATTDSGGALVSAIRAWYVPAASSPAGYAGAVRIVIPNYSGTTFKKTAIISSMFQNNAAFPAATAIATDQLGGQWNSAAAITSLTIVPFAGNFIIGSTFDVYLRGSVS